MGIEEIDFSVFEGKSPDEITAIFDGMPAQLLEPAANVLKDLGMLPEDYNYLLARAGNTKMRDNTKNMSPELKKEVLELMSTLNELSDHLDLNRDEMLEIVKNSLKAGEEEVFEEDDEDSQASQNDGS